MSKLSLNKPIIVYLYGYPGAGKSTFASEFINHINAVHLYADQIRHDLFEKPRFDESENQIIQHLMEYMSEQFIKSGISVIYDADFSKKKDRKHMKQLAGDLNTKSILLWLQIDVDSAFERVSKRDRRKVKDQYSLPIDKQKFNQIISEMQNPSQDEDYVVLSGKHSFPMQKSSIMKRLFDMNLLPSESMAANIVKPGMINLIPTAGRVDYTRRNISIH